MTLTEAKVGAWLSAYMRQKMSEHVGEELTDTDIEALKARVNRSLNSLKGTDLIHNITFKDGVLSINMMPELREIEITLSIGDEPTRWSRTLQRRR
jgi:hypothetical protein